MEEPLVLLAHTRCLRCRLWTGSIRADCKWRRILWTAIIPTALMACLAVGTAAAQSCDSQAVSANGKPFHGAAKMSFVKKCKRDACASKVVSAEGKPLHGAAKSSFMAKCMRSAQGARARFTNSDPPLFSYRNSPTCRSALGASLALRSVSLKVNWVLGLNGMKRDLLDGMASSTDRAFASNRSIKISASIATRAGPVHLAI
jgi:hypothetical protein